MRRSGAALLLVLLSGGFLWGIARLLAGRLESGDVYPAYSSLRSDPLGTRVLHDALSELGTVSVRRGYGPLPEGAAAAETVAVVAGCSAPEWQVPSEDDLREVEGFLAAGGRVVLAFAPLLEDPGFERALAKGAPPRETAGRGAKPPKALPRRPSLRERWGVAFRFAALEEGGAGSASADAARAVADPSLPEALGWRSGMVFDRLAPAWTTLYAREGRPVLVSRRWGKGTLVLASDSYFLSNEAQREEREPALVSALVGPARTVLFDESHLGIADRPGVMTLARRYRLGGVLGALLVLAILYLWRAAASFLPREEEAPDPTLSGRTAAAGLANLLRRGIPPARLLPTCVEEWERAAAPGAKSAAARAIAAAAGTREEEILSAYRRISDLKTKGAA